MSRVEVKYRKRGSKVMCTIDGKTTMLYKLPWQVSVMPTSYDKHYLLGSMIYDGFLTKVDYRHNLYSELLPRYILEEGWAYRLTSMPEIERVKLSSLEDIFLNPLPLFDNDSGENILGTLGDVEEARTIINELLSLDIKLVADHTRKDYILPSGLTFSYNNSILVVPTIQLNCYINLEVVTNDDSEIIDVKILSTYNSHEFSK